MAHFNALAFYADLEGTAKNQLNNERGSTHLLQHSHPGIKKQSELSKIGSKVDGWSLGLDHNNTFPHWLTKLSCFKAVFALSRLTNNNGDPDFFKNEDTQIWQFWKNGDLMTLKKKQILQLSLRSGWFESLYSTNAGRSPMKFAKVCGAAYCLAFLHLGWWWLVLVWLGWVGLGWVVLKRDRWKGVDLS